MTATLPSSFLIFPFGVGQHFCSQCSQCSRLRECAILRDDDGNVAREETTGVFIFIGAKPRTEFLPAELARDDKGFALTGSAVAKLASWKEHRLPEVLETSLPGVFASGDCRSGTSKREAFAIGDGALAVSGVHNLLGTYPI